jgi:Ser/Thr protein kinase RdoA (MazF antagonist)
LGRLAAEFDKLARDYQSTHQGDWQFPRYRHSYFPDRSLSDWKQVMERIGGRLWSAKRETNEISRWLDGHLEPSHTKSWEEIPQQFLHGDIDYDNAKRNSSRSVLLDLENARWGYRLTEIARACAVIGSFDRGSAGQIVMRRELDSGNVRSFIRGYDSVSRLTETENLLLSDFIGLNLVATFASCFCMDKPSFSQSHLQLQSQRLTATLKTVDRLDLD